MKRKHFLLTLLLLFVGVTGVSAQEHCTEISQAGWTVIGTSSDHSEGRCANIIDGDASTYWHSNYNANTASTEGLNNKMPQWVIIDLGAGGATFEAIGVQRRSGNNNSVKNYRVYVSDEAFSDITCPATTQEQIDAVKNLESTTLVKDGTFGGGTNDVFVDYLNEEVTGRYVLFVVDDTHADGNYVCMSELKLYTVDEKAYLQDKANELQELVNVSPVGTTFGHCPEDFVKLAEFALQQASTVLANESATTEEVYEVLNTYVGPAYTALSTSRVGDGEMFILKNTKNGKIAIYNNECILAQGSETVVLSNWSDYNRRSFFKLDVAKIEENVPYFTIRSAVDATQYVYAINTNNANSNVGVKAVTDGTIANDMLWKFVQNGAGWNIIPYGGSNGWNCRGDYGGNAHIGQWDANNAADNIWRVETAEEFILAEKAPAASEGKIGGVVSYSAVEEAVKALAATLTTSFTDANLNAYKNYAPALVTPAAGLYKIHNKGNDLHLYSEETANNVKNVTLGKGLQENAKYYWNVKFDGNNAVIVGSTGLAIAKGQGGTNPYSNITADYLSTITLQTAPNDGNVWTENYFVFPNVHSSKQNHFTQGNAAYNAESNPIYLTTWATTGPANQYAFEPVTLPAGAEVYTVEFVGADGSLTYNGADYEGNATVYNGGFYVLTSKPSATDFTASAVSGYTPEVTINGNSITVNYAVSDGAKLYSPGARATTLKTDGTMYMIYNAHAGRYGMHHNDGSANIKRKAVHADAFVNGLNKGYLFTLEAETDDQGAATGKYYIKSVASGTYFNVTGTINNTEKQALNIIEYSTSTHKDDATFYTGENGGTAVAASAITSDQKFWAVEADVVENNQGCWNANPDAYTTWSTSHALVFYEVEETDFATEMAEEIALLDGALAETGVGYPVQEVRNTLGEAITAANSSIDVPTAYTTAINAYKASTNVQMPEDGKAYVLTNSHQALEDMHLNYNSTSDALEFVTRGTVAAQELPKSAHFVCHKMESGEYVFVNNNGKFIVLRHGSSGGYNSNKGVADAYETHCDVAIAKDPGAFGALNLTLQRGDNSNNSYMIHSDNSNTGFNQGGGPYNTANHSTMFFFEEVTYPNTPNLNAATIDGDDMTIGTFSAPFATVIPEGVKAFYVDAAAGTTAALTRVEGAAIPANTGVILTAETGTTSALMVPATTEEQATVTGNLLVATSNTAFASADGVYVLGAVDGVVAFYKSGANTTLSANKAYLQIAGGSAPAFIMSFGGEATGIEGVEAAPATLDGEVYDLSGRRVQNPGKGLYIIGGKKVYIK